MRFTIKLKLGLAFGLVAVMLLGSSYYGISSLSTLNTAITDLIKGPVERVKAANKTQADLLNFVRAEKNIIIETDDTKMQAFDSQLTNARRRQQ
jgi:methyl-accepting chemotaxis protein